MKNPSITTLEGEVHETWSPHHQAYLQSQIDLPFNLEFDSWVTYTDKIDLGEYAGDIPSYIRLDARLGLETNRKL